MRQIGRRTVLVTATGLALSAVAPARAEPSAGPGPQPDPGEQDSTMPETTVYTARRVITVDPGVPDGTAVAVRDGRILAVGSVEDLSGMGVVDDTFAAAFLVPGLIDQHLHPILGATTLTTEVIAIEDWVLPERTYPAAGSPEEYRRRLTEAEQASAPGEWLFSWGYHMLWHGRLDRAALDAVSTTRPIMVWQRSCHEFYLNSAAITELGLTAEQMAGHGPASEMVDFDAGHWWESGTNLLLPSLGPVFMTQQRLADGLRLLTAYLHANGVTAINEPGIMWAVEPWELYQQILGAGETPLLSTFLVDARSQADAGMDPADAVADAEAQLQAHASSGKVRMLPGAVKLFADGAIISQLMQMRSPYLDDAGNPDLCHHGEWMMQPDDFRAFARAYWNADWQLHIHVNGDAGLDLVLDTVEACMAEHPRSDHRTVIVHFANSTEEQIDRISALGCIVSANSYYPVGFADQYARHGLGAERADMMVRAASVLARGIPLSLHSDLPMGPAAPLALASFAVNRRTPSGRVAGPSQRISVHDALRAVTIEAAYSWRMEDSLGSITPGKVANFTALGSDPYAVEPVRLGDVPVLGTVFEGRAFPL